MTKDLLCGKIINHADGHCIIIYIQGLSTDQKGPKHRRKGTYRMNIKDLPNDEKKVPEDCKVCPQKTKSDWCKVERNGVRAKEEKLCGLKDGWVFGFDPVGKPKPMIYWEGKGQEPPRSRKEKVLEEEGILQAQWDEWENMRKGHLTEAEIRQEKVAWFSGAMRIIQCYMTAQEDGRGEMLMEILNVEAQRHREDFAKRLKDLTGERGQ